MLTHPSPAGIQLIPGNNVTAILCAVADSKSYPIRPLRVAVVGCQIGARHVDAYLRLPTRYTVVALCDTNRELARTLSGKYGGIPIEHDYETLLTRYKPDVVNICTPPHLHKAQVLAALEAGVHVVCEKPLVGSLRDLDLLTAASHRTGRLILPVFQMRYGHGVRKLLHLVTKRMTGRCYLSTIEIAWKRGPEYYAVPWRSTWRGSLGGCLQGHAIHALDLLGQVVGRASQVSAFAKTMVNPVETEDCVAAALNMADGSLASLAVTLGSASEISRLRFCFERLVAESNTHPYDFASDPWLFIGATAGVDRDIKEALRDFPAGPEGYEAQFLHAHASLAGTADPPVTLADARAALELTSVLYESADSGEAVSLPLSPNHRRYDGQAELRPGITHEPHLCDVAAMSRSRNRHVDT